MCIHSTLLRKETCYYCTLLECRSSQKHTFTVKPVTSANTQTSQPFLVRQESLNRELARLDKELIELKTEYERKKKTADEKHRQHFEWEQKRYDEAMAERYTEGG